MNSSYGSIASVGKIETQQDLEMGHPDLSDADGIYRLVCESGVLDVNSRYAYLMWCERFSATSLVVRSNRTATESSPVAGIQRNSTHSVLGFVLGFVPPDRSSTLFVWQVAVSKQLRGRGLGLELLQQLLERQQTFGVEFVEAHVGESNEPSARLFRSFAKKNEAALEVRSGFSSDLFGSDDHESEQLFRIGPFTVSS